jgi:alkanesulfonate monooxygenase SsuD/methylene tetrahydromethanopterin reductase-like flavin-dependent oxidoreductase (luciferase family)
MANEKEFSGEIGVHYPLHVLNRYGVPELIALAERARESLGKFGYSQVWTNDNLEYRSVVAVSAAIVARVPVKLGTAITVPYFRNPIDLAMAFAGGLARTRTRIALDPDASGGAREAAWSHG